jgi:hypothetical protein
MEKKFKTPAPVSFEEALEAVKRDAPPPEQAHASRARVWQRLADAVEQEGAAQHQEIRGCEGIRSLFPAYRLGRLSEAREILVQDHIKECGSCRRAYETGKRSNVIEWVAPAPVRRAQVPLVRRFAMAAAVTVVVGSGLWFTRDYFLPADSGPRFTVASASGPLYLVTPKELKPLASGATLTEKQFVRTAAGSKAMLRLRDGSMVEMNERTELAVTQNRTDTTVHLDRGTVIVQAAKRRTGHLSVRTGDTEVRVTGTVFAVDRGIQGSRVSVVEGSVEVKRGDNIAMLKPGDQYLDTRHVAPRSIESDLSWSENADQHIALLHELSKLRTEMAKQLQLPGLRYSSALLNQMPAGIVLYAGLPNLGETLNQAWGIFEKQLGQSPVLSQWWQKNGASQQAVLRETMERIRTAAGYLGDEVVIAGLDTGAGHPHFAFLAEVTRSGLEDYLRLNWPANPNVAPWSIVNNTLVITPDSEDRTTWVSWAEQRKDSGFASAGLGQKLMESYRSGVSVIVGLDTGRIFTASDARVADARKASGLADVRYFVAEHRAIKSRFDEDEEIKAAVTFSGPRHGIAAALAAPAAAGSLDFFSPNASIATALVVNRPEVIFDDLMALMNSFGNTGAAREFAEIESHTGLRIREDLAAALGTDVTFGIDGPYLPVPAWKIAFEVKDQQRLLYFMDKLTTALDTEVKKGGKQGLALSTDSWQGATIHTVKSKDTPLQFEYTVYDGYWIVTPNRDATVRALRTKSSGWRLANNWEFRERLPLSSSPHFSGLVYVNLRDAADAIGETAGAALDPAYVAKVRAVTESIKPVLVCLYGEGDAIRMATRTGLLGLTFDQWLGATSLQSLIPNPAAIARAGTSKAPRAY